MCLSPYVVKHPDGLVDMVRCGRCRPCRIRRKESWIGRLHLEFIDNHKVGRFVTLTYAEDPGKLNVEDLQKFMKRYRYYYGPCRYFAVGEYGDQTERGHWHVIIFGHAPKVIGHWKDNAAWSLGFSYDGECNHASMRYVAAYCFKDNVRGSDRRPLMRQSLRPAIGYGRIAAMAVEAAKVGVEAWPTEYRISGRKFPVCDGGLRLFMREYLNAGGSPPVTLSPEDRHAVAVVRLAEWGSRIQVQRQANALWLRDNGKDRYGTPSAQRSKI